MGKLRSTAVEEIDGDDTEQMLSVAAAVDVAKASGMVCVRHPHPSIEGRRTSKVWEVDSTTNSILALGLWKQGQFPIDKLVKAYDFANINTAFEDSESGAVVKPLLVL